ncbi:hypothetical protein DV515_00015340 [Chloebia gouldiae]|uniref:Uncharacterized protein n=1 Tax=Chloebia gouldiae TaxID=44316 RepID=A0A3L8RVT5_CHLGU|nr:hypothetical protein DV515_00015340 [Chloebia gouldiae]
MESGTAGSCSRARLSQRTCLPGNAEQQTDRFLERAGPAGSQIWDAGAQPSPPASPDHPVGHLQAPECPQDPGLCSWKWAMATPSSSRVRGCSLRGCTGWGFGIRQIDPRVPPALGEPRDQ